MDEWYWNPSRAIPVAPGDVGPITEFPFFTFLYADLHAHMIALPLTVLGPAWAASWLLAAEDEDARLRAGGWLAGLFAGGLILGALRPTNTWDFPVYLTFGVWPPPLCAGPLRERRWSRRAYVEALVSAAGAGRSLLPRCINRYTQWYGQGYTNADVWHGSRTTAPILLRRARPLPFSVVSWMVWETRRSGWRRRHSRASAGSGLTLAGCGVPCRRRRGRHGVGVRRWSARRPGRPASRCVGRRCSFCARTGRWAKRIVLVLTGSAWR